MRSVVMGLFVGALALAGCSSEPPPKEPPLIADPPVSTGTTADDGVAATELQRGDAFFESQKYKEAKEHYERALAAKPSAKAAHKLGVCFEKTGDKKGAEEAYKKAIELDPTLADPAQDLSALYLDEPPRPDEAIALLKTAVQKAKDPVRLYQNLGYAYGLKGDLENAGKAYEAALAKGEDAQVRFSYGSLLFDNKKLDQASVQLKKALAATKDDPPMLATLGTMLGATHDYAECVQAFDRAIKLKGTEAEWFVRRGTCKHELKNETAAREDYQQATKVDPKFAPAYYYLGLSFLADKQRQNATIALKKAVELAGDKPIGKAAKDKLDALAKKK